MARLKDPREMAARAAEKWFDSLMTSHAFTSGSVFDPRIDEEIDGVQEAVKAEHEKTYGPAREVDAAGDREIFAREAGYMVGVQIGLRLRRVS